MGHQFRSGVSSEDTLPFYIAPTFRAFDFVNLDGEDVELLVGVTAFARMTALHLPLCCIVPASRYVLKMHAARFESYPSCCLR